MCNRILDNNLRYSPTDTFGIAFRKEAFPGIDFITNATMMVIDIKEGFIRIVYLLPICIPACLFVRALHPIGMDGFRKKNILYKVRLASKERLKQTSTNWQCRQWYSCSNWQMCCPLSRSSWTVRSVMLEALKASSHKTC